MNEMTLRRCRQLIDNRDTVKSVYKWEGGLSHLCCAGVYSAKGLDVDGQLLQTVKALLRSRVSAFSNFRSAAESAVAAMLAISGRPEETLENGLSVYALLKKEFRGSSYLPLTAMVIAQTVQPAQYEEIAARTRAIYRRMKAEHPFLTSSEDSAVCAMLALSNKTDDALISDMEACYQLLRPHFFTADPVQSLSHVLALCDGTPADKCGKVLMLFDQLKAAGHKYGTEYELPTLGVLAFSGKDAAAMAADMAEIDSWLAMQKGFGIFGSVTKKQRLMYAGMLAQPVQSRESAMQTAAIGSTIALMVAQEAAMCAAIVASSAAAAHHAST